MTKWIAATWMTVAVACLHACGNAPAVDATKPSVVARARLFAPTLSRTSVRSGEEVRVFCSQADANGAPVTASASHVLVRPEAQPAMHVTETFAGGKTFQAEQAGTYQLFCTDAQGARQSVPRQLQVVPGDPVQLRVQLSERAATVGQALQASCVGVDAAGNIVQPPPAAVPQAGMTVLGASALVHRQGPATFSLSGPAQLSRAEGPLAAVHVTPSDQGDVAVRCVVPNWPSVPASQPVLLQVRANKAAQVVVRMPPGPFAAGEPIPASCQALDHDGQAIAADVQWDISAANALVQHTADGLRVERSGTYAVACRMLDGAGAVVARSESVPLHVVAGPASGWQLKLWRQGPCFSQNMRLPISWRVWDAFGNKIKGTKVALTTVPPTTVERDESDGFVFVDEGVYDITIVPVGLDQDTLEPYRDRIVVDSTPPQLRLLSPARAGVVRSDANELLLSGEIYDAASDIVSFQVENVAQPAFGSERQRTFSVPYKSRWGLNVVHARAVDACGNAATLVQSFTQSSNFAPLVLQDDGAEEVRLPGAVRAALSQSLWDHGAYKGEQDIRHLIELALINGGLNERLPQRLASWPENDAQGEPVRSWFSRLPFASDHPPSGVDVLRDGPLVMADPSIESLRLEDDGFRISMVLHDVQLPVRIVPHMDWLFGSGESSFHALLHAPALRIEAIAQVFMHDGVPAVEICPDCVTANFVDSPPSLRLREDVGAAPVWQRWVAPLVDWVFSSSCDRLVSVLEARVRHDMSLEMVKILRGLKLQHGLPLQPPLSGTLNVGSGLDNIIMQGDGNNSSCLLSLYSTVDAQVDRQRPASIQPGPTPLYAGAIRRSQSQPLPLQVGETDSFSVSVADDLLNQMFWSLWVSGVFNHDNAIKLMPQDSDRAAFFKAADLGTYFMSPPVVMPSNKPGEIRIGIGDVYGESTLETSRILAPSIAADEPPLHARFWFSMSMRVTLGVDDERQSLKVLSVHPVHLGVELIHTEPKRMTTAVQEYLEKYMWQAVSSYMTDALVSFPLPNLQIGLLPGVPDEAAWALQHVSLERPIGAQEIVLRGALGPLPLTRQERGDVVLHGDGRFMPMRQTN